MKTALLISGFMGANAKHVAQALRMFRDAPHIERYGVSSSGWFDESMLPRATDIVLAGWDVRDCNATSLAEDLPTRGVITKADTLLGDEDGQLHEGALVGDLVDEIHHQVAQFMQQTGAVRLVLVNCTTPARRIRPDIPQMPLEDILRAPADELPSSILYALACARAQGTYVDFTPSQTLEFESIEQSAQVWDAQFAGRDGSTGQTYLKMLVAAALELRGIHVRSWYSTNILGNRDGEALALPGVGETKMADKAWGLDELSRLAPGAHQVDIRHVPQLGDVKEAWDSVTLEGFMGNEAELRINWRAPDSPVAAQSILDLTRIASASQEHHPCGLRRDLAFFFKRPRGVRAMSPIGYFHHMAASNQKLLVDGRLGTFV